jgi:hypothetical protein
MKAAGELNGEKKGRITKFIAIKRASCGRRPLDVFQKRWREKFTSKTGGRHKPRMVKMCTVANKITQKM